MRPGIGIIMKKKLLKRRGGRPGAAICCQSAVNASLPSRLPTSPSAIFDGSPFQKRKRPPSELEKSCAEKLSGPVVFYVLRA